MPRPTRFFIPGHVWHITHRCHNKAFLLDYQTYRKLWIKWLYEGISRYNVATLNFTVTSNHIHLLILAPDDMEAIPRLMQLVASRVGQTFNIKQSRKGAFWENRYRATAVQTDEHLLRCLLYIDFNMVRAGVVTSPDRWEHCGYHEIVKQKKRYKTIKRNELARLLSIDEINLSMNYQAWINEALEKSQLSREPAITI
jgi:putative transposase